MQIRVVDRNGQTISPSVALVRYAILAAPWFLSANMLPSSLGESWIGSELGVFLGGVEAAIAYLYVFNRQTRQSLHDLIVGTYVVESVTTGAVEAPPLWNGHLYASAGVVLGFLVIVPLAAPRLMRLGPFPELKSIQATVQSLDNVGAVGASVEARTGTGGSTTMTVVTVNWKHQPQNEETEATRIAAQVLSGDQQASSRSSLLVRSVNGYDIGIAHVWKFKTFAYTPERWREIILASPTQAVVAQ